jgi:hypothetical protein
MAKKKSSFVSVEFVVSTAVVQKNQVKKFWHILEGVLHKFSNDWSIERGAEVYIKKERTYRR